jgi:hypothetical protein
LQKASKSPTRLARQRCRQQRPQSGSEQVGQTGREPAGRGTQYDKGGSEAGRHGGLERPCGAVQHSSGLKRYLASASASAYPLRRRMRRSLQTARAPLPRGSLTCATDGRTATATATATATRCSRGGSACATRQTGTGARVWHAGSCRQIRQRWGPSACQGSGWGCSRAKAPVAGAATRASVAGDGCALLAVAGCRSCRRMRQARRAAAGQARHGMGLA